MKQNGTETLYQVASSYRCPTCGQHRSSQYATISKRIKIFQKIFYKDKLFLSYKETFTKMEYHLGEMNCLIYLKNGNVIKQG